MKKLKIQKRFLLSFVGLLAIASCKFSVDPPSVLALLANVQKILPRGAQFSCEADDATTTAKRLVGVVKDFDSALTLQNVRVSIQESRDVSPVLTDAAGAFRITDINPSTATVTVNYNLVGYDSLSVTRDFSICQNHKVTANLNKADIAALGVNVFKLDESKLDSFRVQ